MFRFLRFLWGVFVSSSPSLQGQKASSCFRENAIFLPSPHPCLLPKVTAKLPEAAVTSQHGVRVESLHTILGHRRLMLAPEQMGMPRLSPPRHCSLRWDIAFCWCIVLIQPRGLSRSAGSQRPA